MSIDEDVVDDQENSFFILVDVPNQSDFTYYSVTFDNNEEYFTKCGCAYSLENEVCKHMVAAGLFLQNEHRAVEG